MNHERCQYANSEPNMVILLAAELVQIIVNSGVITTPPKPQFSIIFSDFCLKRTHTTKKSNQNEP